MFAISKPVPASCVNCTGSIPDGEPESGAVVCAPDVYLAPPGDCLPLGPSAYMTEMAKLGLTFPQRALPARQARSCTHATPLPLFQVGRRYRSDLERTRRRSETGQAFQPGFVYVSYIDRVESNGVYYMLQNGGWIPGKGLPHR